MPSREEYAEADFLVQAQVARPEIQLLAKFVEGLGHLGVVTTIDKLEGRVVIQTTKYLWPELKVLLEKMPINIKILNQQI
nr:DUF4911 domain-containing protein [Syntrophobotulus glycolicus]